MIKYILSILISLLIVPSFAQKVIRDQSITYQQERMVFKQWDKKKFTPTGGFLGLNPNYLLTWALHPDYPKKDLRPLGSAGPQSQRLAFAAAMQSTENAYKLHSDTLKNISISEAVNYSGLSSQVDPLWLLYYRYGFEPLLNQDDESLLAYIPIIERDYLVRTGVYDWYREESAGIRQRLQAAMNTIVDRGSRMLAYHRLFLEYRKLNVSWEAKKQYAQKFLSLTNAATKIRLRQQAIASQDGYSTDREIADDILSKSKL